MRKHKLHVGGVLAASVAAALCSTSAVASVNYSFSGSGNEVTGSSFSAVDAPNVTVTGWANTVTNATTTTDDDKLASQKVYAWGGGLGVLNSAETNTTPNHSTDNYGPEDMVLFSFASDIALTGLSIGWSYNDSDMTVLAYTGGGGAAPALAGKTYGDLFASGWKLISHISDVSGVTAGNTKTTTASASFNTGVTKDYSSYWLVGAYNPLVGNSMGWTNSDYVKISGLTGEKKPTNGGGGQVPEPATLLLLGAGLLGMTYMRRRETLVESAVQDGDSLTC